MKNNHSLIFLVAIWAIVSPLHAQQDSVKYVDNEECGCELVFINGIQTTQDGHLFGFKREDGTQIVPNKYYFVDKFHGKFCKVMDEASHTGLINDRGIEVLPCRYADIYYPTEGLIAASIDGLWGFFDTTGTQIIAPQYLSASSFSEGFAAVAVPLDSTAVVFGYINHDNKMVIQPKYQYGYTFHEGLAVVKAYDRYGAIDTSGREVFTIKHEVVTRMMDGCFFAGDYGEVYMYNKQCKRISKHAYYDIISYNDGLFQVIRDGLHGFVNTQGREVIHCQYEFAGAFHDGAAMIQKKGRYGIIDTRGHYILPPTYDNSGYRDQAYIFHEGLALVELNQHYGFVDRRGHIVIPIQYGSAYHFAEGLAPVRTNRGWGYIDYHGEEFIPCQFEIAGPFEHGRAEVVWKGQSYKMNPNGECVKNCSTAPKTWKTKSPTTE